jgi:hypothetical protein
VTWEGDGEDARFTVRALPVSEADDVDDTLELACSPFLGVCVAANQIVGGVGAGESLEKLAEDFTTLSNANRAARENRTSVLINTPS